MTTELVFKQYRVLKKPKRNRKVLLLVPVVVLVLLFSAIYFIPSSVKAQDDYTFGTETVNKGVSISPTERHTENAAYNQLQESDQYTDTNFSGSSENVVTGTAGGGAFPGSLDTDDASRRTYTEANTATAPTYQIIRPSSDGSSITMTTFPASPTTHYTKVNEVAKDDEISYNAGVLIGGGEKDVYGMADPSDPGGTPNIDVTMWIYARGVTATQCSLTYGIVIGGTSYVGASPLITTTTYTNYSYTWTLSPVAPGTNEWTFAQLATLSTYLLGVDGNPDTHTTQVALLITFTPTATYQLDAQITYNSVTSTSQTTGFQVLCQGYRNGDTENINVQAWNYTSSAWVTKVTISAGSDTDYNFNLLGWDANCERSSGNVVLLRAVDASGGDAIQTVVYFDVLKVNRIEQGYALDVELTATGVAQYGNITLRIKGYTSAEEFDVNIYNYTAVGYDLNWMAITSLSNTWQTTLNLNDTHHRSGTNVKIQFLDATAQTSDTTLDILYLDVAWVTRYHTDPAPSLYGADPSTTNLGNAIIFFLNYTDYDNEAPSTNYPKVHIDSSDYTMTKNTSGDSTYYNGVNYSYSKSDLTAGSHNYYFIVKDDSSSEVNSGSNSVSIHQSPTLSGNGVNPPTGNNGDSFAFFVMYDDVDDDLPIYMKVHIDSTDYDMAKNDSGDYDPPIAYNYAKQMSGGTHPYYFKTADQYSGEIQTTPQNLNVNNIPTLSGYGRAPGDPVYPNTLLNFTVTYTDLDGDLPSSMKWRENGGATQNLSMVEVQAWDTDVTDGKLFYKELYLSHGNHDYDFYATDGMGGVSGGSNSITIQNRNPSITNKLVSEDQYRNQYWEHDYSYDEPDEDTVEFEMVTNASFLNINSVSGLVYGTTSDDIGWYDVQVWCNDSYGGTDTDLFILNVYNMVPVITNGPGAHVDLYRYEAWYYDFEVTDADEDPVFWEKSGPAWLSIDSGTGNLTGSTDDVPGLYTFTVYANDSYGGSDDYTFDIHLTNRDPVISNGPGAHVDEWRNTAWQYDFDATDADTDTIYWGRSGVDWLSINSNGLLSGTTAEIPGEYAITVYANDSYSGQDTYPFTLHVINRVPTITSAGNTTQLDGTYMAYNVTATDADSDYLTCEFSSNASWLSLDAIGWWVNGTAAVVGWYECSIWVNDSYDSDLEHWHVEVTSAGNQPPSFTSSPKDSIGHPEDYYYDCNATDPEVDPLIFNLTSSHPNLVIDHDTGVVTGYIGTAGTWELNISVNDGNGNTVWQNFSLTASNTPPEFDTTPTESWQHGTSYSYDANAHDDNGDSYSFGLAGNCTSFLNIIPSTGVVSGIVPTVGWWYLNVSVSDSNSTTWQYYVLTGLNTAPSFTSSGITEWQNGTEYVYDANANDVNSDSLTFYLEGNCTVYFQINPSTGVVNGTILQMGWWYVNISASDSWSTVWQNFTVVALNTKPSFTTSPPTTLILGNPLYYDANTQDINGDTVYFELTDDPPIWIFVDWNTGEVEGTATLVGDYSIHLRVFDGLAYSWQNWTISVSEYVEPTEPETPPPNPTAGPTAHFSYILHGTKLAVMDSSYGAIVSYSWNFGDGFGGKGKNIIHTYAHAGTYTVRLTVTDNLGSKSVAMAIITVKEGPSYGIEKGESGFIVTTPAGTFKLDAILCLMLGIIGAIISFEVKKLPILSPKRLRIISAVLLGIGLLFYAT